MSMEKETVNDGLEQKTDDVTVETHHLSFALIRH